MATYWLINEEKKKKKISGLILLLLLTYQRHKTILDTYDVSIYMIFQQRINLILLITI